MEIQVCGHNMSQTASWTCFILLPKQKSIPLALAIAWDFPAQCIQKPQRRKSHAHHEELVNVISKNSNILSSGLQGLQHKNKHDQWNSATDSCCFFSHSSVQVSLWRCSIWNDMRGYAVVPGACRVAILDTKRFGQSLNEKPDPQLQWKREWILERAQVNAGPSPWTALGRCVGQHVLCAFGPAAAKRIWCVLIPKSCSCAAFRQAWPWACHWRQAGGLCGDWNLWTLAA